MPGEPGDGTGALNVERGTQSVSADGLHSNGITCIIPFNTTTDADCNTLKPRTVTGCTGLAATLTSPARHVSNITQSCLAFP